MDTYSPSHTNASHSKDDLYLRMRIFQLGFVGRKPTQGQQQSRIQSPIPDLDSYKIQQITTPTAVLVIMGTTEPLPPSENSGTVDARVSNNSEFQINTQTVEVNQLPRTMLTQQGTPITYHATQEEINFAMPADMRLVGLVQANRYYTKAGKMTNFFQGKLLQTTSTGSRCSATMKVSHPSGG